MNSKYLHSEIESNFPLLVFTEDPLDCKQMHLDANSYSDHIYNKAKKGAQFRSLIGDEQFWKGDVCVYLGQDSSNDLYRLWCYRSKKLVFVNDLENLQYMGVTNYPGKISIAGNLLGYNRDTLIITEALQL